MNILLIGMPGCGKSTVGVLLAKVMQYTFTDCDLLIQKRCGMRLQEIINKKGLKEFLKAEEETLCEINEDGTVIATGGSAVYSEKAMKHLKDNAVTVYLSLPLNELENRLTNIKTRGVAMENGTTLKQLYDERTPLYEKYADIVIETTGLQLEETVESVARKIRNV